MQKNFKIWVLAYDNDNDAFIPEMWANESLAILEENMVIGNLVHRDFSEQVASFGDVVNTRKPNEFTAKRKTDNDSVTIQDASSDNIPVSLNQWIHVSFMIKDGEQSKSFKDLVTFYVQPAMLAQARLMDQILLGQGIQFKDSAWSGDLGAAIDEDSIIDLDQAMNDNKVPVGSRNLIVNSKGQADMLKIQNFVQAYAVGDDGQAMREARLTKKYGFNIFMSQNTPSVATGNTTKTGAINNAAGYSVGATALTVDGFTGAVATGAWVTIAGDMTPYRITAHTETTGNTTAITLETGLRRAVADNAVVTSYTPGAVNNAAGYEAGYAKEITVDAFTVAPRIGQPVTFGANTTGAVYTIVDVNALVGITLDRPLEAGLSDNDAVNIGPAGAYNMAFTKNALALVSRPLAVPKKGTGALSAVVNYNNLGMRATITYDGERQGHLVTLDALLGVAVLDADLGALLYGR